MSARLDQYQRGLSDYAEALGGRDLVLDEEGRLHFDLDSGRAAVRVKDGGSRIRGSMILAQLPDDQSLQDALDWVDSQQPPPTAELDFWEGPDGVSVMRMVWERPIGAAAAADPIVAEISAYLAAWRERVGL